MLIKPNWPAPDCIEAFTTLRADHFKLNRKQTESDQELQDQRHLFKKTFELPTDPIWLHQTHGRIAIEATPDNLEKDADASFSQTPNRICIVLTADCLPVFFCNRQGTQVAVAHAGWRGLGGGILESTVEKLNLPPQDILVWLGPAISQKNYEVGDEVRDLFLQHDQSATQGFIPSPHGRWLADLNALARLRLKNCGIDAVYGGEYCTFADSKRFNSFRRDGKITGHLASMIWIKNNK
jgi:YfiH family protein